MISNPKKCNKFEFRVLQMIFRLSAVGKATRQIASSELCAKKPDWNRSGPIMF